MDFGYLLKLVHGEDLPSHEMHFFEMLNYYFVNYYDIKEMKREMMFLNGGLSKVAKELNI